jgi:hypothetical protein
VAEEFDLLSAVQPEEGWYAIVGLSPDSKQQELVETREEADAWAKTFLNQGKNVFFGVAKYIDGKSRTKQNVKALKSLWLDIDCGPEKDYDTQQEGVDALRSFCKTVGMPKPTLVNSGRGLHVYWTLTEEVTREEWEPVCLRLKEVCTTKGLRVDNSCFEAARILRIPGTFNFKGTDPLRVEVMVVGKPTPIQTIRDVLGVKETKASPLGDMPVFTPSPLSKVIRASMESSFTKIMKRGENGCRQLNASYEDRREISEPRWFAALSIAKFCKDRDKAIHKLSADHPDYDPDKVEQKVTHIVGPHTCAEFEKHNPGGCAGCPHIGKIRSPITLGKELKEATPEDNVVIEETAVGAVKFHIPEFPFPYMRGKHGGVWRKVAPSDGEEGVEDVALVYPYDIYVAKRMDDPVEGGVALIRLHTPQDGVKEFTVHNSKMADGNELKKLLASKHVMLSSKTDYAYLVDFIIKSIAQYFHSTKVEQMRNQFGWVDNDSKFIIGDREISAEGTYHSPPSSVTKVVAEHMTAKGSLEKWREVFDLYGRPGLEGHAFAAATAFGAPLLRFSGQRGAIINVVHPKSGTGKTTALQMANSVYGDPVALCAKKDDTFNSKVFKIGVFCNLHISFDEMSNTEPKQLSELAYLITQGTGKDRMKASSNELRANLTSWQTIALCSSNHSFYEKLEIAKGSPDGETMRIIEYSIDYSDAIDIEYGKKMFDHQLLENYGHAGDIYARYLITHYDEVKALYATVQQRIDSKLKLTQRERFWSATAAANITGIYIALHLGLCNWDIAAIFKWTCKMILNLRNTMTPPPEGEQQILGEFMNARLGNILIINDGLDRRSKMVEVPALKPLHELMIRYEPDTARVYITASSFREYCGARNIAYRSTINAMKAKGLYLESGNKRMSKGMAINTVPVQALIFDANHPDFSGITDLFNNVVTAAQPEADEE